VVNTVKKGWLLERIDKNNKPLVQFRWAELLSLNDVVTLMEIDRLPGYGFTGVTLWSSFMNHGLDSYYYTLPVIYSRFRQFNEVRDKNRIKEGAAFLKEAIRRAHLKGLTLMHGYNICNFVGGQPVSTSLRTDAAYTAIRKVQSDWLNEYGEPDFSKDFWYDFMAEEIDDFFRQFPDIDGLFCFNCESSQFTPSRLYHQKIPRKDIVIRATQTIYDVCRKHGKMMTHDIHSAGANRQQTEDIIAAAGKCPDIILGADCTYSDWHMFLPTTPWLEKMKERNRIYMGFDCAGEYFGKGKVLGLWPNWIIKHFENGKKHNLTAITTRTQIWSKGISAFASPFLNLNVRVLMKLALEGAINLDREMEAWWKDNFKGQWSQELKEILLLFESLQKNILHVNYSNVSNSGISFPDSIFVGKDRVSFFEQFARPGTRLDPAIHTMTPEEGMTVKPFEYLRQEKLDGIAECKSAIKRLGHLNLPVETSQLLQTRFLQAKDVALAHLYHLDAAHALYQQIGEYQDGTVANPRAALREALAHIRAHADEMDGRWGSSFYDCFTASMRKFADSVPSKYL